MNESEWLSSLQVGDKVAVPDRWSGGQVLAVDRLTPTQVVLADGRKFRRDSGRQVGSSDSWNVKWIRPITPEFVEKLERQRLENWLDQKTRTRQSLSIETLRALKAAYEAATGEQA